MRNLILSTLYRMKKSFAIKLSFGLITVAAILYFCCVNWISDGTFDASIAGSISGLSDSLMLWLFGPLLAGVIVIDDFDSKVIHTAISCGKGRRSVVFSKMCVFMLTVFLLTMSYAIISFILYANDTNFAGAEASAISIYVHNLIFNIEASTGKVLLVYLVTTIVYMAQLSICLPLAFKVRKTVVITGIGFIFGMLNAFISSVVDKVDILSNIYELTPYAYTISKVNVSTENGDLMIAVVVSVIFICLMTAISYLLFRREEIK